MTKFIFTEKQVKTITENQVKLIKKGMNESLNNNRYEMRVNVEVETHGVKINGNDIDWAVCHDMELNYLIEMEYRSWGIKSVSLYDIQGPSEMEIEVTPQVEDVDGIEDVTLTLSFDWSNVEVEEESGSGFIGLERDITITLGNNENGDVIIESIRVPVHSL